MPGGADYAMLFAVKHGWMTPLSEKRYNAAINVWIREPALVVTATLGFIQIHQQPGELHSTSIVAVRCFLMYAAKLTDRIAGSLRDCGARSDGPRWSQSP